MKISELIELLKTQDQNLEVKYHWDGRPRSDVLGAFTYFDQFDEGKNKLVLVDEAEQMYVHHGENVKWIKKP